MSGRGKACNTCRKRRVKCDEARPTCHRCLRANLNCGGYNRPLHFRIAVPGAPLEGEGSGAGAQEATLSIVSARLGDKIPEFLHLTAFQPQFEFSCLFENFVWRGYGHGWMDRAAAGQLSPLSLQAATALSQSNFGRFHDRKESKTAGSTVYGNTVRTLRRHLACMDSHNLEELIVPIMLLLIHDSMSSSPKDSVFHVRGLIHLLMMCGPEKFKSQPLRSAFESFRATLITVSLITKKRCFLECESWRSIPWLPSGVKAPQTELAELLVMVPGMLEAETTTRDDLTSRHALFERVQLALLELYRWRWRWQSLFSQTVRQTTVAGGESPVNNATRTTGIHFSMFERSTDIMLYNAVQLWLVALLYQIDPFQTPTSLMSTATTAQLQASTGYSQEKTPLLLPGMTRSMRDMALEVLDVFQYQSSHVQGNDAPALFYLLPIGLAWSVLQDDESARRRITRMLDASQVTKGYVVGQNVVGFGFYLSSGTLQNVVTEENNAMTAHG